MAFASTTASVEETDSTFVFDPPADLTGGTGRFDGATGSGTDRGWFSTATFVGEHQIQGEMSSVGSMK